MNEHISDEMLNAYIDDELDDDDRQCVLDAIQHDNQLHVRLCRLQQTRDMVRIAYDDVARHDNRSAPRRKLPASLVASLLIAAGATGGWFLNSVVSDNTPPVNELSQYAQPADKVWRIVMHVNTQDDYLQNTLLEETEHAFETFKANNRELEVEIVAYGAGIEFLMPERSLYTDRIISMQERYPNLTFTACERSYKRLKSRMGYEFKLIKNTKVAPSGIREIIQRQQEGWHYIRL
ncbi:MAG: hypothetical protein PVH46_03830 [Granulosicoccaceae bacterium]|jgi:intracellular sulfur oxidation DsrE/DsrF family protein